MATPKKKPTSTGRTPKSGGVGATGTPATPVKLHGERPWMGETSSLVNERLEIPIDFKKLP